MENPVEKAREAISALGTAAHDDANQWLTEFEVTPDAWNVAQALLQDPPGTNNRFYGANIFYNKIRRDYIQLKASAHDLKAALVVLLSTLAQENPIDSTVTRRVSLALAALALQLNEPNVVSDILVQLSPILSHAPQVLLDLLMVLPEECYNDHIDVDFDQRDKFSEQLSASAPQVMEFLCTFISEECTGSTDTQEQMLRCFSKWIEHTTIGQDTLAQHPLVNFTMNALRDRDLFDEAVDVVIALLRQFGGEACLLDQMALPAALMPRVLELCQLWDQDEINASSHDDDVCRGIARLMTEMLESYLYIITMTHDIGQTQLLDQLILCAQYPWDFDVSRIPLKGFYELSAMIRNSTAHVGGRQRFGRYYAALLEIVIRQSRTTQDVLMGKEVEDNYVRSELNESVIDVIDVIGAEPSLQIVLGMLQQCQSTPDTPEKYIAMESCLNGVEVIANFLGPDDHESSGQLMAFLTTLPADMPGLVRVRNKIVASFSRYLGNNPKHLPVLMELVSAGLLSAHTTATSAHTLMCLFKFCPAVQASLEIPVFYGQICQLRESGGLPVKSEVDILTGLSHILSGMDTSSCEAALEHLIEPIMSAIAQAIAHHFHQKDILDHLDRITAVMSNTRCPRSAITERGQHPVLAVFLKLLPTFQGILAAYPSEVVCEKVCRCYKHVMRNTQESFFPFLESMAGHVTAEFQTKPFASFIYVSSICVAIFGDSLPGSYVTDSGQRMVGGMEVAGLREVLLKQYSNISAMFFAKCTSIESFEGFPDLVEEYFYYSAKFVQTLPEEFLSYGESISVLQAAVSGLSLRHREAQKGILLFFERFVDMPKKMHELCSSPLAGPNCAQLSVACQDLLIKCMPSLVGAIFLSLSGAVPAYAIDENYGSIADVLWRLKQLCPNEFNDCMNTAFGGLQPTAQEHVLAMSLGESLMRAEHMRRFSQTLELFQRRCKRGVQAMGK